MLSLKIQSRALNYNMMKTCKIILLLGLLFLGPLGVWAAEWGAMSDYVNEKDTTQNGEKYLLRKILNGQTLSIGLERNPYTEKQYEKLGRMIVDLYNDWFSNAARRIKRAGREEEFADILPILQKGVSVHITEEGRDLNVIFMPLKEVQRKCGRGTGGCYTLEAVPDIYLPINDGLLKFLSFGGENKKRIGTHEIGHSLGFSDQYFQARLINSDEMYGSVEERETIMEHAGHLTCDDADGIINLIDITKGTSRGGDKGWKSLCPRSKEYYIGGMSAGKGPYLVTLSDDNMSVNIITYEKGKQVASNDYPFSIPSGMVEWQEIPSVSIVKKDFLGRPLLAQGAQGETIYYAYLYDRIDKVTIKDGAVLNVVRRMSFPESSRSGSMRDSKEMLFGQMGVICSLKTRSFLRRGHTNEYLEGINQPKVRRYLKHGYNHHGKRTTEVYQDANELVQRPSGFLRNFSAQMKSMPAEENLRKQMDRQKGLSRREKLGNLLDRWGQQVLREFSSRKRK